MNHIFLKFTAFLEFRMVPAGAFPRPLPAE